MSHNGIKASVAGALCVLLAGCQPMTKADIVSRYSGKTVSKITGEQRYVRLGANDPSNGSRSIYHAPDGRAYYFKQTHKGYRRAEAGRWWATEGEICYSMRITRMEDPEGNNCAPAGVDAAFSKFESGDVKKLVPARRKTAPSRKVASSGGGVDCTWDIACAIRHTPGGAAAAAVIVAGAGALIASGAGSGGGGYSAPASSGSSASPSTPAASAPKSRARPTGYRIISTAKYGPGQTVVARGKCNKNDGGFSVKYHPGNNPPYFVATAGGRTIDEAALKYCGG